MNTQTVENKIIRDIIFFYVNCLDIKKTTKHLEPVLREYKKDIPDGSKLYVEINAAEEKLRMLKAIRDKKQSSFDVSIRQIADECVSQVFVGIDTSSQSRHTDCVWARYHTWALLNEHTDYGVTIMASMYGNRNHATVISGLRRHRDLLAIEDADYMELWEKTTTLYNNAIKNKEI